MFEREKFTAEAADTAGLFGRERYVGVFLTVNVALLVVLLALSGFYIKKHLAVGKHIIIT